MEESPYTGACTQTGGVMEMLTLGIVVFLGYVVGVFLIIRTAAMIRRKEEMLFGKE